MLNDCEKVYTKFLDKNNNIIYAHDTEDGEGVEYFTLVQFSQKQPNDVSKKAFEDMIRDHDMKEIGTATMSELMEKL